MLIPIVIDYNDDHLASMPLWLRAALREFVDEKKTLTIPFSLTLVSEAIPKNWPYKQGPKRDPLDQGYKRPEA